MIHSTKNISFYFGDSSTSFVKNSLHGSTQQEMMQLAGYREFFAAQPCENFIVLDQVHGIAGYAVDHEQAAQVKPYSIAGDYLITTLPRVTLAVETADCVPLILVDTLHPCVALVHAGWRGSTQGIVACALRAMREQGADLKNIIAYFGPAARGCCYQVRDDFLKETRLSHNAVTLRDGLLYFDNTLFITAQLEKSGIKRENIILTYASCTVCSVRYCSHRREGDLNLRQMTIVALK